MCDAAAVAAHAEREHVRMLDEQQQIADAAGAPLLDERALQRERLGVRHEAEPADFECARIDDRCSTPVRP